jgi:rhodanese-related sulfurtransferase
VVDTGPFLISRSIFDLCTLSSQSILTHITQEVIMPWWWPFGQVPEVEPQQLNKQLDAGEPIQLIDVRSGWEFEQGHIDGARSVPIYRLSSQLSTLGLDPKQPVVAICKTAHRSIPAVRLLRQHGYDARQLAGGMDRWRSAGLPETK